MKMALLNGDDDYHSRRHDISSWLNTLRKLWSLNIRIISNGPRSKIVYFFTYLFALIS
jgi:hypothetical protein